MKKFIFALTLMVSSSAFAVNANSSWDDIYRAGLWPAFEKVTFGNVFVSLKSVCVDGDVLRGGTHEQCVQWDYQNDTQICVNTRTIELVAPVAYQQTICTEMSSDNCTKYESVTGSYKLTHQVPVLSNYGAENQQVAFTKSYTVPACR